MRKWNNLINFKFTRFCLSFIVVTIAQLYIAKAVQSAEQNAQPIVTKEQEYVPEDLLNLSLEELLKVKIVVTASKRPESVQDAPGIINIITSAEIRQFGTTTLFEVLGRLPGVYAYSYPSLRDNVIAFRGQSENVDNHMLVLLNGRPLREGFSGGINGHIYRSFPLDTIDHIEIIRGPGSVLYGTNAFSGVVNIITREPKENLNGVASLSYGSFGSVQGNIAGGLNNKELKVYGGVKLLASDGWKTKGTDSSGVFDSDRHEHDTYGAMFQAQYKNFAISALLADSDSQEFDVPLEWPLKRSTRRSRFIDAGYVFEMSNNWKASFNATYNGYDQNYIHGVITANNDDALYEVTIDGKLTDTINILAGFTHNTVKGTFSSFGSTDSYSKENVSSYLQLDSRPITSLKLIAGVQMNDPEDVKKDFSPRLGVIYQINNNWGTKLLYGRAFRAPTTVEQFLFLPGAAFGDPGLSPEKIETYDAHLYYESKKYYCALTAFVSRISDIISIDPTTRTFSNRDTIHSKGFTLETTAKLPHNFSLQGSYSYQKHRKGDINDFYATPNFMAKIGLFYHLDKGVQVGVFNSFIGGRSFIRPSEEVNPDPDKYNLLTANIRFDLNKLLGIRRFSNTELSIYGDNLLDEDIYAGTPRVNSANTYLMSSGRAFYAKLGIKF